MSWWNPLSWIPEDPVTRCGWYMLSLYGDPKKDPYYDFCSWDDRQTSRGSKIQDIVDLDRYIQTGRAQLIIIQSQFPEDSKEWRLGLFYLDVWPKVLPLFWEGKSE